MTRLLLCLLVLGSPAFGAPPSPGSAQPVGVAISGGVSLGSWEAGFMYAWLEGLKARPTAQLRIVTGASAGSANAFLSAMASCLPPNPNPLEDWGYKAWVPVGFAQLFDAERATDEALFVTDPFKAAIERVRSVWGQGLPAWCDVVFGATVTRVVPRPLTLKEGFMVPRAQETFLVRIQGRGPGRPPRLSNAVDPLAPAPVPLLAFIDDESAEATRANYSQLRALVLASGAFPLAFRAQDLGYCLSKPAHDGQPADLRCPVPDFSEKFVDGGIFDNTPLRLAWNTADAGCCADPAGAGSGPTPLRRPRTGPRRLAPPHLRR